MTNLINCGTCGYPLTPEERTSLIERDGVMVKPAPMTKDEAISTERALDLALEALEIELSIDWTNNDEFNASAEKMYEAITAIKQARALDKKAENARELGLDYEPVQKQRWAVFCSFCNKEWSVSYQHPGKSVCLDCDDAPPAQPAPVQEPVAWMQDDGCHFSIWKDKYSTIPLYTTPPAQRQWTGLTDEERVDLWKATETDNRMVLIDAIEAKLKERNV